MAIPVTIEQNVFSNRANATLYVLKGCKAAYEAADYWKEFKEIVEIGSDHGSTEISHNKCDATTNNLWYTLDGRKIHKKPMTKGLYVRNGRKVVIK